MADLLPPLPSVTIFLVLRWQGRLTVTMGRCFVGGFVVSLLFSRPIRSDSLQHHSVGSLVCESMGSQRVGYD